jgi:Tfp pilus assembly protein PilF
VHRFSARDRRSGNRRAGTRALLGLVVLVLASCRSAVPPPGPPRPTLPEAERAVEGGLESFRAGHLREAQERFRTAILIDDHMLKAHLHYQDTWIARARRGTALLEYGDRYRSKPSGFNHYLYGRLLEDPEEKLEALNEAIDEAPNMAWAHLERAVLLENRGERVAAYRDMERASALAPSDPLILVNHGYFFLRRRQPHRALAAFSKAIRIDPGNDKAYFGLYRTHARYDSPRNAMRSLKECLFLQPTRRRYLAEIRRYAGRHATFVQLKELEDLLARTVAEETVSAELLRTLAWIRDRTGRPYSAIRCLTLAEGKPCATVAGIRDLIRLRVRVGQYERALEHFFESYAPHALLLDRKNRLRPRWVELEAASHEASARPSARNLHRLARAYVSAGWVAEALQVYDRLVLAEPDEDPEVIEKEVRACLNFLNLVRVLDRYFETRYKRVKEGRSGGSLAEVTKDLARLARLHAGVRDAGPLPILSYAFIGSVMDREASRGHPLIRYFDHFNHYFLVGQRSGGPPEALICARLYEDDEVMRPRFGRRVPHRYVLGHHVKVRSFRESLDQNLGGVTIGHEFFLNMDFIHRWRRSVLETHQKFSGPELKADLFHDEAMPAASREEALDIDSPLATKYRLYYLYCEEAGDHAADPVVFLEMVRTHEEGHVLDADRYLPVMSNLWRVLSLAVSNGFSPLAVEAYLEGNAESTALAEGPAPRLSIAQLIGFLPTSRSAVPHSLGYHDVVKRIVEEIYDHPKRFPEIDRKRNILQQLPRVPREKLRALGRKMARERNLAAE